MTREIVVTVPLAHDQAMALLLRAAQSLQHRVIAFDAEHNRAEMRADFSLLALSTFRISAEATAVGDSETRLRLVVRPGFKLIGFTGTGQSERIGWQLIGTMEQLLDPARYDALEDAVVPSHAERSVRATDSPAH